MDQSKCQSCGMAMSKGFFGTNSDGLDNKDYCKFCYKKGQFTEPNLTMNQMIESSTDHMVTHLLYPHVKAKDIAKKTIPTLKRWKYSALEQAKTGQQPTQPAQSNLNQQKPAEKLR